MKAEEAIIDAKDKQPPTKEELRRSRTIAVVLAGFLVIALVAVIYAFVQQTEAKRQEALAIQLMERSMRLEQELKITEAEANRQRMLALEQQKMAVQALEACELSKKKK